MNCDRGKMVRSAALRLDRRLTSTGVGVDLARRPPHPRFGLPASLTPGSVLDISTTSCWSGPKHALGVRRLVKKKEKRNELRFHSRRGELVLTCYWKVSLLASISSNNEITECCIDKEGYHRNAGDKCCLGMNTAQFEMGEYFLSKNRPQKEAVFTSSTFPVKMTEICLPEARLASQC